MSNLKSLRLFYPFAGAFEKISMKMRSIDSRIVIQKHQLYCLEACMGALLSPEMLQAGAVKGLIRTAGYTVPRLKLRPYKYL